MRTLRAITKILPSAILSILVAIAVWIMAVTSSDPSESRTYPNSVPVEIIGQATDLVIITDLPETVSINLRAPASIWRTMIAEKAPVRALIDLSGVTVGEHIIPVQIQVGIKPVEVVSYNPRSINMTLEQLNSKAIEISIVSRGALPVGYQAEKPQLSETSVMVSGAKSWVDQVIEVQAVVDLSQVREDINQTITLQAVDANGLPVPDVTVFPDKVTLIQSVAQRGGYRNVVVKVVTLGQVGNGFRLTDVSIFPPTVTVFSEQPELVDALPGFIETVPIDLTGKQESFEIDVDLELPAEIEVIGTPVTTVRVGIAPVESSLALSDIPVETIGLAPNLAVEFLPLKVNIILSGPVPVLNSLLINNLRVLIDLTGYLPGDYSFTPIATLNFPGLKIESMSPATFEIKISPLN